MKTYIVQRSNRGVHCSVMPDKGSLYPLRHLLRHSPDGYEYGYGGSGPSDLARSIVGDMLDRRDPEPRLYRPVVERIISHLEGDGPFFIDEQSVREATEA